MLPAEVGDAEDGVQQELGVRGEDLAETARLCAATVRVNLGGLRKAPTRAGDLDIATRR